MSHLSRRELLKSVGAFAIAGAGVGRATPPPPADVEITSALSAYMSEAATRKLPDEVIEKTKHAIVDALAAMISGSELPPGRFAIDFTRAYKGDKVATVVG